MTDLIFGCVMLYVLARFVRRHVLPKLSPRENPSPSRLPARVIDGGRIYGTAIEDKRPKSYRPSGR